MSLIKLNCIRVRKRVSVRWVPLGILINIFKYYFNLDTIYKISRYHLISLQKKSISYIFINIFWKLLQIIYKWIFIICKNVYGWEKYCVFQLLMHHITTSPAYNSPMLIKGVSINRRFWSTLFIIKNGIYAYSIIAFIVTSVLFLLCKIVFIQNGNENCTCNCM